MPNTGIGPVRRLLNEAVISAASLETVFRKFAAEGDDEDVQTAFVAQADTARIQQERLTERLDRFGEVPANTKESGVPDFTLPVLETGHIQEERTVHHLITAFAIQAGACAFFEVLANTAAAVADEETRALAKQMQEEPQAAAAKMFSFIRSRSKIAYNMLTPNELDPAVETKAFDNRVV